MISRAELTSRLDMISTLFAPNRGGARGWRLSTMLQRRQDRGPRTEVFVWSGYAAPSRVELYSSMVRPTILGFPSRYSKKISHCWAPEPPNAI